MNRHMMYDYLKSLGLKALFINKNRERGYHVRFTMDNDDDSQQDLWVYTDWGYIRHIDSIHLCRGEVVIEARYSDMKINIEYSKMKKFEVKIWDRIG